VVGDFKSALPASKVYVYDNNSTDNTESQTLGAEAIVRHESQQGKGNVARRMFSSIKTGFTFGISRVGAVRPA
jgi:hypothetical protein